MKVPGDFLHTCTLQEAPGFAWRTGIDSPDGIQWIWIGSHAEYDRLIA
jgi:hypothetical protein